LKVQLYGENELIIDRKIVLVFFYLEIFSIDNSDFMRDGDFIPTRMQAQQDAVSLIFHAKTRSNPENNVGLLTLSE
jgi:26S proteasome regulatory subunit N10